MVSTYTKITSRLINSRKRNIYTKKNSRKKYIKSKGRMINLKTYLKTVKTKRGGVVNKKVMIKEL